MSTVSITIRCMRDEDIDDCLEIWRQIGLVEGRQTVASTLFSDPQGFMVATKDKDSDRGRILGVCAGVMAGINDAFIGFYAVRPEYQGKGIGSKLWLATTDRLKEINAGLHGVGKMYKKYINSGFSVIDNISLCIYDTQKGTSELNVDSLKSIQEADSFVSLVDMKQYDVKDGHLLTQLCEFDYRVVGYSREKLLRHYLSASDSPTTVVAVENVPNKDGSCCRIGGSTGESKRVVGYACLRAENSGGFMLGPLYADNNELAERLLHHLLSKYDRREHGTPLVAMCLSNNRSMAKMLDRLGFQEEKDEECARLYTCRIIEPGNMDKIHLIFSPNFTPF